MSKSVGGIILGVVGAAVGAYLGGPQGAIAGAQLGYTVGGAIDPATIELRKSSVGQRLDPELLMVQTSAYGINIPKVNGKIRLGGNVIWTRNIEEVVTVTESTSTSGGKGGGGTVTTTNTTNYEYLGTFAVAICSGEIGGITKIWADTKLIYNIDTTDAATLQVSANLNLIKYYGSESQIPSSIIEGFDGAGNVSAYRGLAYVVFNRLPLANFGNRIPSLTFEINA